MTQQTNNPCIQKIVERKQINITDNYFEEIIDLQLSLQLDKYVLDMSSKDYIKDQVLSLFDELYELDREIFLAGEEPTPEQYQKINEEFIDCLKFIINIGLYYVYNCENNKSIVDKFNKKSLVHLFTVLVVQHRFFLLVYNNQTQFSRISNSLNNLRNLLHAANWKPWKKTYSLDNNEYLLHYVRLIKSVFKLINYTNMTFDDTLKSAFNKKHSININRENTNY